MDSHVFMSVTAEATVRDCAIDTSPWACLAPFMDGDYARALVRDAVSNPHLTFRSATAEDAELRLQIEGRLGIAAWVKDGAVEAAYPFARFGREFEMEIVRTSSCSSETKGRVSASCIGLEVQFFDVLHEVGTAVRRVGDTCRFRLAALAVSVKRVAPLTFPESYFDGELGLPTTGIRKIVPRGGGCPGEAVFQSPVDGRPGRVHFKDREFTSLPISLAERDGNRFGIDLLVAPEILETLDAPIGTNEDIAGVLWLHGYCPELLATS